MSKRKTHQDYHELAKKRGFTWEGTELPKNTHTPTPWKCEYGHVWSTSYSNISSRRSGCPYCSGKATKTVADYNILAQERGFEWVGIELPKNIKTPTPWKCKNNHIWPATYNKIQQGSGCPLCQYIINGAPTSQLQRDLCAMLAGELNHPCGPYAIDVAIYRENIPIAVEYDAWYWHAGREEHDEQRDRELIAAGWRVLRVRSNARLPTRAQLDAAIALLVAGDTYAEIILDDWGEGPTFAEVRASAPSDSPWTQLTLWDLLDA